MLAYNRSKSIPLLITFLAMCFSKALYAQESIQFTLDQANAGDKSCCFCFFPERSGAW